MERNKTINRQTILNVAMLFCILTTIQIYVNSDDKAVARENIDTPSSFPNIMKISFTQFNDQAH